MGYNIGSLRLVLFLGLIVHKLLWEVLRIRAKGSKSSQAPIKSFGNWPVKIIKGGILIFLIFQTLFLDIFPISDQPGHLRMIGTALYFVGLAIAVTGRLQLGKNWADLEDYQVLPEQSLVTTGIYGYIRHPIYAGDILLLAGLELALNSWLVLGVSIPLAVAIRQALEEETLLSRVFPHYHAYCTRTKRFIPFIF